MEGRREIEDKSFKHKVNLVNKGKYYFYEVDSVSNNKYNVTIKVSCDCEFMLKKGIANNMLCSHIIACLRDMINKNNKLRDKNGNIETNTRAN